MRVKELMKILEKCNPEAIVTNKECRNYSSTIYYWQPTVDGMFVLEKANDDSNFEHIIEQREVPLENANVIFLG